MNEVDEAAACAAPKIKFRFKYSREPIFTKDQVKDILQRANERRLSKEVQDQLSLKDDLDHSFAVTREIYASLVNEFPIPDEETALDETRATFKGDPDMENFMATLLHVKYDFTGEGPIQEGEPYIDVNLHDFEGNPTSLSAFVGQSRPLVVFADAKDQWPLGRHVEVEQAKTLEQRIETAKAFRAKTGMKLPMVVDCMANQFMWQFEDLTDHLDTLLK